MKMCIFQALQSGQYSCVWKGAGVERQEPPQQRLLLVWQEVVNADYCPVLPGGLVESESGKAVVVVGRGESWAAGAEEGSKL